MFCPAHLKVVWTGWRGAHSAAPVGRTADGLLCRLLPGLHPASTWVTLAHCPSCSGALFGAGGVDADPPAAQCGMFECGGPAAALVVATAVKAAAEAAAASAPPTVLRKLMRLLQLLEVEVEEKSVDIRSVVVTLGAARELARDSKALDCAEAAHAARTQYLNALASQLVDTPEVVCFEDGVRVAVLVHELLEATVALLELEKPSEEEGEGEGDRSRLSIISSLAAVVEHVRERPPSRSHVTQFHDGLWIRRLQDANQERNRILASEDTSSRLDRRGIERLMTACRADQMTLENYAEEMDALRLAVRLRDEGRWGVAFGTRSALRDLEDLLSSVGWIDAARLYLHTEQIPLLLLPPRTPQRSVTWANSLLPVLNGCLSTTPLDLTFCPPPATPEEKELDYLQTALKNPHRLELCEMVKADTAGTWILLHGDDGRMLPFGPPGALGLFWHEGTKPVGDQEAAALRHVLLARGIDPRLYTTHGPTFVSAIASFLMSVHAFASAEDLYLKVHLVGGPALNYTSSSSSSSLVQQTTTTQLQAPLPPLPAAVMAHLTGTGISRRQAVCSTAARFLGGLSPLPGAAGEKEPSEILRACVTLTPAASETDNYVQTALAHCNTRVPAAMIAQDYVRGLGGRPQQQLRVYSRQRPDILPPGMLGAFMDHATQIVDPRERYRFLCAREGRQVAHPNVFNGWFPNAVLSLLLPEAVKDVPPAATALLRNGERVVHHYCQPDSTLYAVDLSNKHDNTARFQESVLDTVMRARRPGHALLATDALLMVELGMFPADGASDPRLQPLAEWTAALRRKLGCNGQKACACPRAAGAGAGAEEERALNTLACRLKALGTGLGHSLEAMMDTWTADEEHGRRAERWDV